MGRLGQGARGSQACASVCSPGGSKRGARRGLLSLTEHDLSILFVIIMIDGFKADLNSI